MTQRLPIPGSDNGTWGSILNGFLEVSHNADGTLSPSALTTAGGITSVNSKTTTTGAVTLAASDVGALTQATANGLYVPTGNTASGVVAAPAMLLIAQFNGTNETTTFQTALTAAAGGTLVIPAGRTITTQTVTIPSNTTLIGEGPGATINIIDDGTSTGQYVSILNVSNVIVQGLTIESTNATGRTGVNGLLRLSGASNVFIRQNFFGVSSATAVFVKTTTNLEISGNIVNGPYADGFHISRGSSYVRIFGNNVEGTGDDCIAVNSQLADGATTYNTCEEVSIFGNTVGPQTSTTVPGSGIAIYGGTNISVTGNVVKGVSDTGIKCMAAESGSLATHYPYGIVISSNTIENPTGAYANDGDGVYIADARQVIVNNNRIDSAGRFGIYVYRIAKEITVSDNVIMRSNSLGIYLQQNTTTSIPALLITELFTNLGESGATTPPLQSIHISGNVIRQCGGTTQGAITVLGESGNNCLDIDVSHNNVDPNNVSLTHCIALTYVTDTVIQGNRVIATASNTLSGIVLGTASRATIVGNTILGPGTTGTGSGITYNTCSNVTVSNNVITAMSYGFYEGGAAPCLITDNILVSIQSGNLQGSPLATSVYRGNLGYNPTGVQTVSVPTSGTAVTATYFDRDFYVTAGASTCTMAIQSGPSVVIPSGGFGLVRVPAAKTVTPTYSSAPTWLVEGN